MIKKTKRFFIDSTCLNTTLEVLSDLTVNGRISIARGVLFITFIYIRLNPDSFQTHTTLTTKLS
jgi:hypothetical protein